MLQYARTFSEQQRIHRPSNISYSNLYNFASDKTGKINIKSGLNYQTELLQFNKKKV
jgi:hypothetical protein